MRSVSSVSLVRRPWRLLAEVSALLIAVVVAFPLYWMVLSAFKPAGEIESSEPRPWTSAPRSNPMLSPVVSPVSEGSVGVPKRVQWTADIGNLQAGS